MKDHLLVLNLQAIFEILFADVRQSNGDGDTVVLWCRGLSSTLFLNIIGCLKMPNWPYTTAVSVVKGV